MLLLAGFAVLAAAACADIPRWRGRVAQLPWAGCAAAAVIFAVAGARALAGHPGTLSLGSMGGLGTAQLRADRLSGLFLLLCFAVAVPVLLAGGALVAGVPRPRLGAAVASCLGAVALILTAGHVFVFLFGWEALTVAFYLITGYDRNRPGRGRAAMLAAGFGKLSGALLMLGFLILAGHAHSLDFAAIGRVHRGASLDVGYVLLLLGFGVKTGLVPVQIWLPPAYAAAPGPARAVLAAVAVNTGFYGMWRTLDLLGAPPVWLAVSVLAAAGITAILGITHAAVHADLAYLVGWSSVENAGVITAGFGAALAGAAAHNPKLVAVGLLAGMLQATAHAVGKAALFVSTGAVEQSLGTTDLDRLRGVARRLRAAGTGLVLGSLTLAGLPLTAGFASEWFTLESLMQQFRIAGTSLRLATALAGALVALTVGVAGVTFVRLVALTAFGHPTTPSPPPERPRRSPVFGLSAAVLSLACVGLGAVAPLEVRVINAGLAAITGTAGDGARSAPWVLQPVFAGFSALSPSWLAIVLPGMLTLIGVFALAVSRGGLLRVRRVPAWTSASAGTARQAQYTSFGYANALRRVLANLLRTRSRLNGVPGPGVGRQTAGSPAGTAAGQAAQQAGYQVDVVEVVEQYLYLPVSAALFAVVRQAKRLQSGRLDAYLAYLLIALVAVLAVVAATA
jgi:hydrogenase-4 component B